MSAWATQFIVFEARPNATTAGGATKQSAATAASLKLSPLLSAINIAGPCPPEAKPKREWAPPQASPICACHVISSLSALSCAEGLDVCPFSEAEFRPLVTAAKTSLITRRRRLRDLKHA